MSPFPCENTLWHALGQGIARHFGREMHGHFSGQLVLLAGRYAGSFLGGLERAMREVHEREQGGTHHEVVHPPSARLPAHDPASPLVVWVP